VGELAAGRALKVVSAEVFVTCATLGCLPFLGSEDAADAGGGGGSVGLADAT
jgi:hypothetical protein